MIQKSHECYDRAVVRGAARLDNADGVRVSGQGAGMTESLQKLRQHLLTGVSYAIPFVAAGGILIAVSLAFAPKIHGTQLGDSLKQLDPIWLRNCMLMTLKVGETAFNLMLPVLAGYVA